MLSTITVNPRSGDRFIRASVSARSLEFTVISAEDLRINGKHVRNNVFAIVKVDGRSDSTTKVDPECGSYPYWNEKFLVELPPRACFITVEVHRRTSSDRGKLVGAARIPVSDFIGGYAPDNYLHLLSYRLRDAVGERNGIINVSVRATSTPPAYGCSTSSQPEMGIPVSTGNDVGGGTATGVPVWYPFHACRS